MAADDGHDMSHKAEDTSLFTESFSRMNMNERQGGEGEPRLGAEGEPAPRTEEEYAQTQLTLRAIVTSKEAGVIIGKGGKNVADLRNETGVKAGVSKVVQGIHDRVLTITGSLDSIAKAYAIVAKGLLEGAPTVGMGGVIPTNGTHRKYITSRFFSLINPTGLRARCCCLHYPEGSSYQGLVPFILHMVSLVVNISLQLSVFLFPTTRWALSSVDKA